jgi:Tol biopolymer transport system component
MTKKLLSLPLVICITLVSFGCTGTQQNYSTETSAANAVQTDSILETPTIFPSYTLTPRVTFTPTTSTASIPDLVGKIAFVAVGKQNGIFVINADGSNMRQVRAGGVFVRSIHLSWSPDGNRIAFNDSPGPYNSIQIYDLNIDDGTITQITTGPHHKLDVSWSPDGKYLAYIEQGETQNNIVVVNADGAQPLKLTYGGFDSHPTWSPDGNLIAYIHYPDLSSSSKLYVVDANGANIHKITDFPVALYNLAWSPDGSQIALVSGEECGRVYTVEIATGNLKALSNQDCAKDPTWSPNSAYIAYVAAKTQFSMTGWKLYLVKPDGSQTYLITTFADLDVFNLAWSP